MNLKIAPLSYIPNEDEAHAAMAVAKRRNELNRGQSNLPGGETASKEDRQIQHYIACLAEIAVARLSNLYWTGCGKGADGLRDVGGIYEVRSITDRSHGLLVRQRDLEGNPPFVLVFVHAVNRRCEILGWYPAQDVRRDGREIDSNTTKPFWVLSQDRLYTWTGELR